MDNLAPFALFQLKQFRLAAFGAYPIDQPATAVEPLALNGIVHLVEVKLVALVGAQAVGGDHIDQHRALGDLCRLVGFIALACRHGQAHGD